MAGNIPATVTVVAVFSAFNRKFLWSLHGRNSAFTGEVLSAVDFEAGVLS
jgi:hypothetical protein